MATPNKYQPTINMPERVAAAYWQGALTRQEAQKVFDEYGAAIQELRTLWIQLDTTIAYLADKFQITPDDVNKWASERYAEQAKAQILSEGSQEVGAGQTGSAQDNQLCGSETATVRALARQEN